MAMAWPLTPRAPSLHSQRAAAVTSDGATSRRIARAMLMVEAMETAAANGGQITGERIRDGFYARRDWVPEGFQGVCAPSNFSNEDHRGTLAVALYRSVVRGDTTQASVDELMRNCTMRLEPVTTVNLDRRRDWLGW